MGTIEIHPAQGGEDAEAFARDLAAAISKHSQRPLVSEGTTLILHRL